MTMTAKELNFAKARRAGLCARSARVWSPTQKAQGASDPPTNVNVPVIMGNPQVGYTLTCTMGNWNGTPTAYGAQWLRNAAAIPGATFAKYLVTRPTVGKR